MRTKYAASLVAAIALFLGGGQRSACPGGSVGRAARRRSAQAARTPALPSPNSAS